MPKNLTKIMLTIGVAIWLTGGKPVDKGDTPGDPCIRCGENFIFIPNEEMGALREVERQGFVWGSTDPEVQKKLWY